MQLHEAIGQRQAEPGALELAAETAVDLLEGREGTRDVLGGDADAGVAHLENEAAVAGAARGQRNTAAFRRELDGVDIRFNSTCFSLRSSAFRRGRLSGSSIVMRSWARCARSETRRSTALTTSRGSTTSSRSSWAPASILATSRMSLIKVSRCCALSWMSAA